MMHVLLPYYQSQLPTVYMPIIISLPLPSNPTAERKILACRLSVGVTPNPCAPLPVSEAAALRSLLGNAIGYVKVVDCLALPIDVRPHCLYARRGQLNVYSSVGIDLGRRFCASNW